MLWRKRYSNNNLKNADKICKKIYHCLKIIIFWILPSSINQLLLMIILLKRSLSFKNTSEWKKMKKSLTIGCRVRPKEGLGIESHNILIEEEWQLNGTNIILCITIKITHLQKLYKGINSIYFIQICMISKKHHNIICKPHKVLIIVWLNSKLDHHIKISLLKF